MQTTRFAISSNGLRLARRTEIQAGHGYYLGASSSPFYVLVLGVTEESIAYVNASTLERRVERRWIVEDLISTAGETVKRRAIDDQNNGSPCREATWARMMAHGAAASPALCDRQEVTLQARGEGDHYGAAKANAVLVSWDGRSEFIVECDAAQTAKFAADERFVVTSVRTLLACPTK
jgi:hypothetical protein